ncbi:DUF3300 domain-containing protein [Shewanella colwelliana]|uniref:DUF3300 domain-containing protein n=1 Tax=Shewanella colwelliana TaxID=23 RepID=UPI0022B07586|nr:DUF3300 domain-containing protein [Shewanella colwelliana]MCZ4336399.1 DUF3300 domain-containing protein [Shewanella colwelliana]
MNSIKQGTLILLVALSQLLLAPSVFALDDPVDRIDEIQFSEAQLAQVLAPIALYPDSLLTHILIASTYPLEVVQANRWRNKYQALEAEAAVKRAEDKGWDPSILALLAFPTVLEKLSDDLDWTQKLGDAFLQDEARVLASIQTLRQQADNANTFDDMDNMKVTKVNQQIIIEPVQKEIVYVPVYDTRVVYGHWRWYNYPPVYWVYPPRYPVHYPSHYSSRFYWHSGIHISFNYYFSAFHWHKRHIVVTHHHRANRYRSHNRIVTSSGAQRWNHKPAHRRGVAYRSTSVKQRYHSHKPTTLQTKQLRSVERHGNSAKPKHYSTAQIKQSREQRFSQKLAKAQRSNINNSQHKSVKQGAKESRQQRNNNHQRDKSLQPDKSQQQYKRTQRDKSQQQYKSTQRERSHQPERSQQKSKNTQQSRQQASDQKKDYRQQQAKSQQRSQSALARSPQRSQPTRNKQRDH